MTTAARLNVEFNSNGVSGVKNDITGVGNALDSANGKGQSFFSNMMSTAGGFILAGGFNQLKDQVLGLGSSIINANSNMEMWTMQLAVSTGSMESANDVIKDMQNMAKISPFDLPELIQGANALESLGFSSQKWMTVIGDTAAGTNKSVDQVVQAMMDASTGEFERLKELGIRTSVQGDKIQFSFMKNGQMMTIEAENTAEGIENALFGIWDDKYGGAMETMSDTWVGRLGNFKDTINMALMDFGAPLFDTMKEVVTGATMFLETFIRRVDEGQGIIHALLWSIPETLRNLGLGGLADTITPAIKGIETAWNRVGRVGRSVGRIVQNTLGKAFEFLGKHMDVVAAVGKAMLTVFAGMMAWGAITAIVSLLGAAIGLLLSPIALAIAAVAALYLAWDNNWFGIQEKTAAAWAVLEPIFNWIKGAIGYITEGFEIGGWEEAWDRIQTVASEAWDYIKRFISDFDWAGAWGGISDAASGAWDAIRGGASAAWEWLSSLDWGGMVMAAWDVLSGAGEWIAEKLGGAVDAIQAWFSDQFGGVDFVSVAREAAGRLGTAIGTAISDGIDIYRTVLTWITEQINKVDWNNVGQTIGSVFGKAMKAGIGLIVLAADILIALGEQLADVDWDSLARDMWEYLKAAALAAMNLLIGIGQGIMDELGIEIDGIEWGSLWDPIFAPFRSGFNSIIDFAEDRINDLIDLYNSIPGLPDIDPVGGDEETAPGRTKRPASGVQRSQYDFETYTAGGPAFDVGKTLRDAADAAGIFDQALLGLDKSTLLANSSLNATASVTPMVGGAMTTTAGEVQGASGLMGSTFGTIASTAAAKFGEAKGAAIAAFSSMQSSTIASALGMQAGVAGQMATLQSVVTSQSATAKTNASTQASSMAASVGGHVMGMQLKAAVQMALMASTASTQGSAMNTGLTGWISGAVTRIAAGLSGIPGIIRNVGGTGHSAGYYAGSMISQGFASGMLAYLGTIQSAASQMVAAASNAVIAKAMISSPSRLFKQYGAYIGEGMELGILGSIPDISRAADQMIGASLPSPAFNAPLHAGGYGGQQPVNQTIVNQFLLTPEAIAQLEDGALKGAQVHDAMTNRNSASQYRKAGV